MKILINERLSEHKYKTPEGYLICTDAILARTGKQEYRRKEVFGDSCDDADDVIEIDRTEEEVFSPATLASFENKPITVEHPDVDVNSDNYKDYAVGFVRDVKRGVADGQDVILGTLVITDRQTIEEIENGEHTDLSCGYDCDIADEDNPQQRNIRGNHVALCAQGRAGIARIVDSKVEDAGKFYIITKYRGQAEICESLDKAERLKNSSSSMFSDGKIYEVNSNINWYKQTEKSDGQGGVYSDLLSDIKKGVAIEVKDSVKDVDITNEIHSLVKSLHSKGKDFDDICNEIDILLRNKYNRKLQWREIEEITQTAYNKLGLKDSIKDYDALEDWMDELDYHSIGYTFINGGYGMKFGDKGSYYKAKNLAEKCHLKEGVFDDNKMTYFNFKSERVGNDSIKDSLTRQERELCDYMLENAYDRGMKAEDLLRKMKVYYSAYANLARSKPDEVLEYFEDEIESGIYDSIKDVNPIKGESKEEFIERFMKETKSEYPDEKQRYAVANSYWNRRNDSIKDSRKSKIEKIVTRLNK